MEINLTMFQFLFMRAIMRKNKQYSQTSIRTPPTYKVTPITQSKKHELNDPLFAFKKNATSFARFIHNRDLKANVITGCY